MKLTVHFGVLLFRVYFLMAKELSDKISSGECFAVLCFLFLLNCIAAEGTTF